MCEVCSCRKTHLYRCCHMRISTVSARKRNRNDVLANYNKTRINIGHQHDCWMKLKESEFKLMPKCHFVCTSEIVNDARRQAAHKNNKNTQFFFCWISPNDVSYYILTLNAKKTLKKSPKSTKLNYTFNLNRMNKWVNMNELDESATQGTLSIQSK